MDEEKQEKLGRISFQVEQEMIAFDQEITLSSGVKYNHRDTLKKINNHKRCKFHNCTESDVIFWPLGLPRQPKFAAKLDVDTRHFQVEGYGDYNYYQAWACNIRFRKWARDTKFAEDLDNFGDAVSDFGSCAIKLVEDKDGKYDLQECDLMKLWFDPTIRDFYNQTKIELHELQKHEVLDKGWEKAWDKAEVVNYEETEKSDIVQQVAEKRKFFERIGYYNTAHYEKNDPSKGKYIESPKKDKWEFCHTVHSGTGADERVVFFEVIEPEDDIYVDIHLSKYEDRWMRIGIYERLFDLQRMINEAVNYDKECQQISSLLIFYSKNKQLVGSNIFQAATSGLITDTELQQIGITNTFMGEFVAKMQMYERKADELCSVPDMGELSQKTFRGLAAQLNIVNSAFKKARDRVCLPISEIIVKRILPFEMKNWNKEKSLEISGFEIDLRIYDAIATVYHLNEYLDKEFAKGRNPTEEEKKTYVEKIRQRIDLEGRELKFGKNFYDFDYGLGINATGEAENKEQMNDAYFNVISWVLANPAVNYIPAFREYCEKNFITPFHLTAEQTEKLQQGQTAQPAAPAGQKDKLSSMIDTNQ